MDASYKIQRGIHVHLIQFFMCPEFWVHITFGLAVFTFILSEIERIKMKNFKKVKKNGISYRLYI